MRDIDPGIVNADTVELLRLVLNQNRDLRILDAGAGDCRIAVALAQRGHHVLACDIAIAADGMMLVDDVGPGSLVAMRFDLATRLPDDLVGQFDAALLLGVLHYADSETNASRMMDAVASALSADGRLALSWIVSTSPPTRRDTIEPSLAWVCEKMTTIGFRPIASWTARAHHRSHGPEHDHTIGYGVWVKD